MPKSYHTNLQQNEQGSLCSLSHVIDEHVLMSHFKFLTESISHGCRKIAPALCWVTS